MTTTDTRAMIPVDLVDIAATGNDRTTFGPADLADLAASIAEVGQLTAITVRPAGERFELVAGERRFRAITDVLGHSEIWAVSEEVDDETAWARMLHENLYRVDLDPVDEGRAMRRRSDEYEWTLAETARQWRRSATYCSDRMALLELDDAVADLVRTGQLSIGKGASLSQLDHAGQREAIRRGAAEMSADDVRRLVSGMVAIRDQSAMFDGSALEQEVYDTRLSRYIDAMAADAKHRGEPDEIVGPTEVAERLGVSRATVASWRRRHADFPAPRGHLGAPRQAPRAGAKASEGTPWWHWGDVELWAIATGRAPEQG
jgi:ParB/RepB/Spo0J family partition protein